MSHQSQPPPAPGDTRPRRRWPRVVLAVSSVALLFLGLGLGFEMRTSRLQAWYFSRLAATLTWQIGPGPSPEIRFPGPGPYDVRHGYARLPAVIDSLDRHGFVVDSQARMSPNLLNLMARGLSPIYRDGDQSRFEVLDREGAELFASVYPSRVYPDFDSIPPLVWKTLLFIEDRNLLDARSKYHNPAVNWPRLIRAVVGLGGRRLGRDGPVAGASTLATQIEKFRHSPEGRTEAPIDKLLQMASASLRAYLEGPETLAARRRIVTTYLNAAPFAGIAGFGEVTGLGDALWAWYGADFAETNRLLREAGEPGRSLDPATHGVAFRRVLHLLMAVQRPSYFLTDSAGQEALARRADRYLDLLERQGLTPPSLRDVARSPVTPRARAPARSGPSFVEAKAANAVRTELLIQGRIPALYQLDRMDASVASTFDSAAQARVTAVLSRLGDSAYLNAYGLIGPRLQGRGDPARVQYAVVLYERTDAGNAVRVQADNVDLPFSPIEGAKLELGSTAKLRTLVSYLEAVEQAARELREPRGEAATALPATDPITAWVRGYLSTRPRASLVDLLEAAMDRRYSANPRERFFTGGGIHTFGNFESVHDNQVLSVRDAFRHSVNLVFIRMMRDLVQFHMARLPGHPAGILDDRHDPRRQEYLARFADREGRVFLDRFLRKHDWTTADQALATLLRDRVLSAPRLAWVFRSVVPQGTADQFIALLATQGVTVSADRARELFERANPGRMSLMDRGFLAGVHPLELWLVEFRLRHPNASRAEVMDSSQAARQEVYRWLFSTRRTQAQDQRIRSVLEVEAFFEIHRAWRRLGYPFASLVPSYATAIGSSADRPEQLAELVGIILNDGIRMPGFRIDRIRFAAGTPFETVLRRAPTPGERVLSAEIAATVREAMIDVVENGTGRRAFGAVRGADGQPLPIGAKTGTGNNRHRVVGRGGRIVQDRALNRTSTVVFFVGDRFFGTITAFVIGPEADDYDFTSSLPAQLLRVLGPALRDLIVGAS